MKKSVVILCAFLCVISCNNPSSKTSTESPSETTELPPLDTMFNNENSELQIRGIGVINRGEVPVTFFEPGNQERTLNPDESCDYEISNAFALIKISGQDDQWSLEKQKRYQLIIDDSGAWDIEEIP